MRAEKVLEPGRWRAGEIARRINELGSPEKARALMRFFKTGPGQYGHGDVFAGLTVPEIRRLERQHRGLPLPETVRLLRSPVHEARLLAIFLLIREYSRGNEGRKAAIYDTYLQNTRFINNWDLVDASAGQIVGAHLSTRDRGRLYELAVSPVLWERRISIIATFFFIKSGEFEDTLRIAEILLHDPHDLIHKAVGWMLREIGKRDRKAEQIFLDRHCGSMPRTMLRYAIERFPERLRQLYLRGLVSPPAN